MRTFTLETQIVLPRPREVVFPFFADARNLEAITPGFLRFRVLTASPITMRAGTLIDYHLRLRGIPIRWRTRIRVWEPPCRFVDEQINGPYREWTHEHTFEDEGDATRCHDRVDYQVFGGSIIERLFVRADVLRIFVFRQMQLSQLLADGAGVVSLPPTVRRDDTVHA